MLASVERRQLSGWQELRLANSTGTQVWDAMVADVVVADAHTFGRTQCYYKLIVLHRVWQCMQLQVARTAVRLRYLYAPQDLAGYLPLTIIATVSATHCGEQCMKR
jgi:hypothetical protein